MRTATRSVLVVALAVLAFGLAACDNRTVVRCEVTPRSVEAHRLNVGGETAGLSVGDVYTPDSACIPGDIEREESETNTLGVVFGIALFVLVAAAIAVMIVVAVADRNQRAARREEEALAEAEALGEGVADDGGSATDPADPPVGPDGRGGGGETGESSDRPGS